MIIINNNFEKIELEFHNNFKRDVPDKNGNVYDYESVIEAVKDFMYTDDNIRIVEAKTPNFKDRNNMDYPHPKYSVGNIIGIDVNNGSITLIPNDTFDEILKKYPIENLRVFPKMVCNIDYIKKVNKVSYITSFILVSMDISNKSDNSGLTIIKENKNGMY